MKTSTVLSSIALVLALVKGSNAAEMSIQDDSIKSICKPGVVGHPKISTFGSQVVLSGTGGSGIRITDNRGKSSGAKTLLTKLKGIEKTFVCDCDKTKTDDGKYHIFATDKTGELSRCKQVVPAAGGPPTWSCEDKVRVEKRNFGQQLNKLANKPDDKESDRCIKDIKDDDSRVCALTGAGVVGCFDKGKDPSTVTKTHEHPGANSMGLCRDDSGASVVLTCGTDPTAPCKSKKGEREIRLPKLDDDPTIHVKEMVTCPNKRCAYTLGSDGNVRKYDDVTKDCDVGAKATKIEHPIKFDTPSHITCDDDAVYIGYSRCGTTVKVGDDSKVKNMYGGEVTTLSGKPVVDSTTGQRRFELHVGKDDQTVCAIDDK